jgi:hypothetical protein
VSILHFYISSASQQNTHYCFGGLSPRAEGTERKNINGVKKEYLLSLDLYDDNHLLRRVRQGGGGRFSKSEGL